MPDEEQTPQPELISVPESVPEAAPDQALSTAFVAPELPTPRGIAPIWHTLLLIAAILTYSFWGAQRISSNNPMLPVHKQSHADQPSIPGDVTKDEGSDPLRILRYALSAGLELLVVVWVILGLRLRKIRFRSLFGAWPRTLNDITKEAGIAAAFWLGSMLVLLTFALTWNAIQTKIYEHQTQSQSQAPSNSADRPNSGLNSKSAPTARKPKSPQQEQQDNIKELMQLAPSNGLEIAAWGLLCLIVGFSEELIFRGYFQQQGISLFARIPISIILTSLIFGAAHGYQGIRGICLISIYGALFSIVTLLRKNLFPAMLSHAWHDFATGLALALIREGHLLDRLPQSY